MSKALRQSWRKNAQPTGLVFDCDIAEVPALDPLTEQAIYRVTEAAQINVVQHAATTKVHVQMQAQPAFLLKIQDNGVGFDPFTIPDDRYGLTAMFERAELAGAQLLVESESGRGTNIRMEIREVARTVAGQGFFVLRQRLVYIRRQ